MMYPGSKLKVVQFFQPPQTDQALRQYSHDGIFPPFLQVDIEINGESVPLQMKLGEAGEAFFVREVDDDSVPMSLSTSPIPSSHQIPIERDTDLRDTKKEDIREGEPVEVEEEVCMDRL